MKKYKIPQEILIESESFEIHTDTETGLSFCTSYESVVKKVNVSFSWEWVQDKKDLSKNNRLRMVKVKVLSTEPDDVSNLILDEVKNTHLHFGYEASFALLQPGSITSKTYPLIELKKSCFIFDLDGTLVDTQTPFHAEAECHVLNKHHGLMFTPQEISARFSGISTKKVFEELVPECDAEFLVNEKWDRMYERSKTNRICEMPYIKEMIRFLDRHEIPIGIATASPIKWIDMCLKNHEENIYFDRFRVDLENVFYKTTCSVDECQNSKPHPEVFLKAKDKIFAKYKDIKEEGCKIYVVGDGRSDVLAGLSMNASVLFLSESKEFDKNPSVKRFETSEALYKFIIETAV